MKETFIVPPESAGKRLDAWLCACLKDLSRSRIQTLIEAGHIRLNDRTVKPGQKLPRNASVSVDIPPPVESTLSPEAIPLDILFEDADIIVINKPAGLVVHPAAGHASGTLVNALLAHCPDLAGIGGEKRPGIVHRLDRDTTGVIVVAKNAIAMASLVNQFRRRLVTKEYLALVWGTPRPASGRAETLIGRHPRDRKRMSAAPASGRPALTLYETAESFPTTTLLRVKIETGRTHQIRVHMMFLGHPIVGDPQYGRRHETPLPFPPPTRQMLHAARLTLSHPRTGATMTFEAPLSPDMATPLSSLRNPQPNS